MSIVDDDCVHVSDVYSTFNNIGADQHVVFTVNKIQNSLLQVVPLHLPVRITNAEIRTKSLDHIDNFGQTANSIVHKKYLTTPFRFKINGVANYIFIVNLYLGFYRLPVWWRCVNDAKVSRTH